MVSEDAICFGEMLERSGWRQGSIVRIEEMSTLLAESTEEHDKNTILIIASQSCDIACDSDPYIEISICRLIESLRGDFTFNKNPRTLHTEVKVKTGNLDINRNIYVELNAYKKIQISKQLFLPLTPDETRVLPNKHLEGYVSWLAARYSRPALPTAFNNRIIKADPKRKLRKKAKSIDTHLSGIYIELLPETELPDDQHYKVNLLGLAAADFEGDLTLSETVINDYAEVMRAAGMDVTARVAKEDQISIAVIKRFKRFYYDDLSIKNDSPLPPETQINL